jgi:hypothetical protein
METANAITDRVRRSNAVRFDRVGAHHDPWNARVRPRRAGRRLQCPCAFQLSCLVAISLASLAFNCPVRAQVPKAIRIVVPFTPGGGSDLLGRILADHIRRVEGTAAVVENRGGRRLGHRNRGGFPRRAGWDHSAHQHA